MATLKELETDVLIIGAGNAALVAAEAAYDAGLKVTALERAPKERRGGDSAFSGGLFRFAFKDFEHVKEIVKETPGVEFKDVEVEPYPTDMFYGDLTPPTVRHVAIEASDPVKTAAFYQSAFELKELGRSENDVLLSDGTVSVAFVKHQGDGSCQVRSMGMEVKDPEAVASGFAQKKSLGNGKFEVKDIDGNTLELAANWQV